MERAGPPTLPPEPLLSWLRALYLLLRENDEKALFLVLLLEEAGVPLPAPGDMVIMFAGYRASVGQMDLLEAAIAVTLGVQMGSTILYLLSRRFGHALLVRYGRFIHLDQHRMARIEHWIRRHGPIMVMVGRLTPGLRIATSVVAGAFKVPIHQFLLFATLSAVVWSVFWLGLGYHAGRTLLPLFRQYHSWFSVPALVAAALVLGAGLAVYRWRRGPRYPASHRPPTELAR